MLRNNEQLGYGARTGAALVASAALLLAGCSPEADKNPASAPAVIDLNVDFPDRIPKAAQKAADATVWVQTTSLGSGNGSGVKIGKDLYLTGGHVLTQSQRADGSLFTHPLKDVCGTINAPYGRYIVESITDAAIGSTNHNIDDRALIAADVRHSQAQPPVAVPKDDRWEPGDIAYFTNYQTETVGGQVIWRGPGVISPEQANTPKDTTTLAIYAGVLLKKFAKPNGADYWVVATGLGASYGKGLPGDAIQKAASGGPVSTSEGFGGLSLRTSGKISVEKAEDIYGVDITYRGKDITVAEVEVVTKGTVKRLQEKLIPLPPDC